MPLEVVLGQAAAHAARRARLAPRRAPLDRARVDRARRSCACCACRPCRQDLPDHDRRPHGRRPDQRATRWSAVAGAGGDAAVTVSDYFGATPARPWRWASAPRSRCSTRRVGAHGGRRGADTNIAARPMSDASRTSACRPTGWRRRRARRGRRAVRHGARGRRGALPGARHRDPGRQGLAVHEDGLADGRGERRKVVAPVSLIVSGLCAGRRRARTLTPQLRLDPAPRGCC
jgi:hypothetical protein